MRIQRVVARAFGPFSGEALDLAEGMTVVLGPNEAGKTTWHAAIRAAVCGVRRARGRATTTDALFEQRHRPWDGDNGWQVEARLALDDGRTVEISQDLAGKVACRATDVTLGRDVSDEIIFDGTPDASRWLGLDRDAFASTICVSQAQILAIANRDTAAALQEHMQRAASTRGTDATAAEARERLATFRRDHVGVDRAGARGPLRASLARVANAQEALAEARRRHAEFLEASVRKEAADRAAAVAARRVAVAEAAIERRHADAAERRAARAAELAERHPNPPTGSAGRDGRADAVARAVEAWQRRPRIEPLAGPDSAELERRLASLPPPPEGDTEVHPSVAEARRAHDLATDAIRLRPPRPVVDATVLDGPDEETLRTLARRLRTPEPAEAPELEAELAAARAALGTRRGSPWVLALVVAAALAAVGAAAVAAGQAVLGIAFAALAAATGIWWLSRRGTGIHGAERVARAEAALAPLRAARSYAGSERSAATALALADGLPPEPDALDRLADLHATARRQAAGAEAWDRQEAQLQSRLEGAVAALRSAVADRDPAIEDGPAEEQLAAYTAACHRRADQARRAAGREALQHALVARHASEAAAATAADAVASAQAALREAASGVGIAVEGRSPDEVATALAGWQSDRAAELKRSDEEVAEWQELIGLLDGRSVADLRAEADERSRRAAALELTLGASDALVLAGRPDLEMLLAVEHEDLVRARRDADSQDGALEQMRLEVPDVAEAEEAMAEATAEHARVTQLAAVMDETQRLLRRAEELVHRDLAPILAGAIRRWLPVVSAGGYVDASVDPADLSVQVKEAATGRWRPALLLSEGTREQIYLLLRVAMAEHLVTTGETAPLILDEVTAQADPQRAERLLDVLHHLSAERQVVLFSHDPNVAAWAERTFDTHRDRLVLLGTRGGAPVPVVVPA